MLDNDRVIADVKAYLTRTFGEASPQRYWAIFEQWCEMGESAQSGFSGRALIG